MTVKLNIIGIIIYKKEEINATNKCLKCQLK